MSNKKISKTHEDYLAKINKKNRKITLTQISILVLSLCLWETAAHFKWIDSFLTSYPSAIWKLFLSYVKEGNFFHHVGISVFETVVGFIAGTFLGVIMAIGLWWSDFWAKVLDPYLVMLNSLPKTALAPIIIIYLIL